MADLELRGAALLNGAPVTCTACASAAALTLDRRGPRETWPAWLGCQVCGHGEDHPVITNGLIEAAVASRTSRQRAEDRDLFAAEWRHLTLVGECEPEFVLGDAVAVAQELGKLGRQELRTRTKPARKWWRGQKRAAQRATRQTIGAVKVAALTTAWNLQTGAGTPVEKPRTRCRTKGCRGGWVTITTRIHTAGTKPEKVQTPCGVCHRA